MVKEELLDVFAPFFDFIVGEFELVAGAEATGWVTPSTMVEVVVTNGAVGVFGSFGSAFIASFTTEDVIEFDRVG